MEYPIEPNAPDPTWSDSLVDVLKRSLFSKDKGEAEALDLPEQPSDPSIQWSDVGDIWENFLKKSASRSVDFPLKPFELLSGRDLSADIGVPGVEDWDMDYRDRFETGPYGWLRHLDKASYGSGIASTIAAYYGLSRIAPTVAGVAYPAYRYFDKIHQMNKIMKIKRAIDSGVVPKGGGILNAIKDFAKVGGQSILRPIRHINPKRWFKSFDKKVGPYNYKGDKIWVPKSEKLTSYPERNLFSNLAAKGAILGGADLTRSLLRGSKADEIDIDVPRGIETVRPAGMPAHLTYGG